MEDSNHWPSKKAWTDPASPLRQDIAASPLLPDQQVSLSLVLHFDEHSRGKALSNASSKGGGRDAQSQRACCVTRPCGAVARGRTGISSLGLSPRVSVLASYEHPIGLALEDPQDVAVEGDRLPLPAVIILGSFRGEKGKPDPAAFQDDAAQQRPAAALPSPGATIDRRDERFVQVPGSPRPAG